MPHPTPAHKSFSDRTSLYQEITGKIIAELVQGRVPWVQPWAGVTVPLALPRNAATGRHYSGLSILILWCAVAERGFSGQSWLTVRQGLAIGAHVRKGEKGTTVVYADRFIPYRERTRAAKPDPENEESGCRASRGTTIPTAARQTEPSASTKCSQTVSPASPKAHCSSRSSHRSHASRSKAKLRSA